MNRFNLPSVVLLLLLFIPLAGVAREDCASAGGYSFVCGPKNAEDLVRVPGTPWVIASGMAPDSAIHLINSQDKTWTELYPANAPRARQNMDLYGACPGSPDPNNFVSHGLNIRPGIDGHSTLYVVGHGGREAIEVFDVDTSADAPVLTWTGCVLTPEGLEANSVASLADGSLLATIPLHQGFSISDAVAGKITGGVYAWSPGDSGFTLIEGTEQPYVNGVEVSADGEEFYVVSSALFNFSAYSNSNPAELLRSSKTFPIVPDNLHMGPDGKLLTAGLNIIDSGCGNVQRSEEFSLAEFASCPRPFTVLSVDSQSANFEIIAVGEANKEFSNITMALPVDDELWIGTFAGDRIAYRPLSGSE